MSTKVSFYVPHFEDGGVARSTLRLATHFVRMGHIVHLVTNRPTGSMIQSADPGIRVIDLRTGRALAAIPRLVQYLRKERPDAFISAQPFANITAVWARALSRTHPVLIVTERLATREALARMGRAKRLVMPRLIRCFYPRADAMVANSKAGAEHLQEFLGRTKPQVRAIYNPTFDPRVTQLAQEPLDHPWFIAGAPPVIVSAGRLSEQKDYPTLLRAFAEVRRETECRLLVLGEGAERASLEAVAAQLGISGSVAMPGYESNPYRFMSRAAVFVLSSRYEGLPNVLIEAQACGAPVVSTDCPTGPREILLEGKAGLLSPVGDPDALAGNIVAVLRDRPAAEKMKAEASRALDRFTPEACYSSYVTLISSCRDRIQERSI